MDSYFAQLRPEMLSFVPLQRHRVLEIGCGAGNFVASINGVGETWGIEPTSAAKNATQQLHRVIQGRFEEVESQLPLAYFDVIVCNDVIEHMMDHAKFLRDVQKYLAPGGALIGSLPNVRFYSNLFEMLFEKDWFYRDDGILDRTHLAFFTEKSIRRTLNDAGFKVVRLQGINRDIPYRKDRRIYLTLAKMLSRLTFGYFDDIRSMQFGFQAVRK